MGFSFLADLFAIFLALKVIHAHRAVNHLAGFGHFNPLGNAFGSFGFHSFLLQVFKCCWVGFGRVLAGEIPGDFPRIMRLKR
jgi:hypothetical protein